MRFLFAAAIALVGCKATPQNVSLNQIAEKELGEKVSITLNVSKTFALAKVTEQGTISYAVIQLSDRKVILKKERVRAEVTWSDDTHIKETRRPEVARRDGDDTNSILLINIQDYLVKGK